MMDCYKKYITKARLRVYVLVTFSVMLLIYLGVMVNFDLFRIYRGIPSMMNLVQRMMSPNYNYAMEAFGRLRDTLEIAVLSSMIGVVLAIPFAMLTAYNITPNKILPVILNPIFTFFRTIPNLIWAAILVTIFSIGKLPGISALTITAFLISLKLFREQIESINPNVINSVKSVGANPLQVLRNCVLPLITELSITVYFMVLEVNIRSATVLGLVGAGGIGQILWRDLNHLRYDNVATLIVILFITIGLIDLLSLLVRNYSKKVYIEFNTVKSHRRFNIFKVIIIPLLTFGFIYWVKSATDISFERFMLGVDQTKIMITRMVDLDFSYLPRLWDGIKESLFIALYATVTGAMAALILSYFAAYNVAPFKGVSLFTKLVVNILRTFPPIITAIIFFRGVGAGPLAGALALSIYTTGVLTKLYSEVLENTPSNIKDGILVAGGSNMDTFKYGLLPHTFPTFISLVLYRLESNVRTSTILGIIGAGGIGSILYQNIAWRNWERVGLLLLGISTMMIAIDTGSYYLRKLFS